MNPQLHAEITAALDEFASTCQGLHRRYKLIELDAKARTQHLGKWVANGLTFASRAAAALRQVGPALADLVPFSAADIDAQRGRVIILERAQTYVGALLQSITDTLLVERAALYAMASGVLNAAEWSYYQPYRDGATQIQMAAVLNQLRKDRERKNRKISATKRLQAQEQAQAALTLAAAPAADEEPLLPVLPLTVVVAEEAATPPGPASAAARAALATPLRMLPPRWRGRRP